MSTLVDTAVRLFLESEMETPCVLPVDPVDSDDSGVAKHSDIAKPGHLVVFSRTCPDKDEPNDDSAAVIRLSDGALVMAVADGVGGAPLGYKASAIAVQCIAESLQDRVGGSDLRPAILNGIERANSEILDMGTGAATTISIVEVQNRIARGYQVGDSMAMIVGQRGTMKWRSTSHSPVGYLIESGAIEEAEAMLHDERHIVSNLVGSREMHIEIGPAIPLSVRDSIVIASDGLFDNLQLGEIAQLARVGKPIDRMNALVALADKRMRGEDESMPGKPDDLAVILMTP